MIVPTAESFELVRDGKVVGGTVGWRICSDAAEALREHRVDLGTLAGRMFAVRCMEKLNAVLAERGYRLRLAKHFRKDSLIPLELLEFCDMEPNAFLSRLGNDNSLG